MAREEQDRLQGFVDLHLHAGPALIAREFSAEQAAAEAVRDGCAALVLKDHHCPTMSLAQSLDDRYSEKGLRVRGGVVLNSAVGGLNPRAVETAAGFEAALVWMPTVSARNHQECLKREGVYFPPLAGAGTGAEAFITWEDPQGRLTKEAEEVLEVLAVNPEMVLATGHGSRNEVDLLVKRAAEKGIPRILVNHPLYMVGATDEDLKAWTGLGAFLEFTAIATLPGSPLCSLDPARVARAIRLAGPERVVLSSDLGLKGCGFQMEGMAKFLDLLEAEGITPESLDLMVRNNPASLLAP